MNSDPIAALVIVTCWLLILRVAYRRYSAKVQKACCSNLERLEGEWKERHELLARRNER